MNPNICSKTKGAWSTPPKQLEFVLKPKQTPEQKKNNSVWFHAYIQALREKVALTLIKTKVEINHEFIPQLQALS